MAETNTDPSTKIPGIPTTIDYAANLANLLPTGTVLAFKALASSLSNKANCLIYNKYLTLFLVAFCALVCFLSSFTDSFISKAEGKLYHGFATRKGLCVFNLDDEVEIDESALSKFKVTWKDFLHAFVSLLVFLVIAVSDSDLQSCFFRDAGADLRAFLTNLPAIAGLVATYLFIIFPTERRGIGYAYTDPHDEVQVTRKPTQATSLV